MLIEDAISLSVDRISDVGYLDIDAAAVGAKRVAEAQRLGVTPGKLNLVGKMIAYADNAENINKEEWLHKSVKDIMAETNKYK